MSDAYEWDEAKRAGNLRKHGIDFVDALDVFEHPHALIRSDRNGEERWGALGRAGGRIVVVFFTPRGSKRRLISARAARRNEKERYYAHVASQSEAGLDRLGSARPDDG